MENEEEERFSQSESSSESTSTSRSTGRSRGQSRGRYRGRSRGRSRGRTTSRSSIQSRGRTTSRSRVQSKKSRPRRRRSMSRPPSFDLPPVFQEREKDFENQDPESFSPAPSVVSTESSRASISRYTKHDSPQRLLEGPGPELRPLEKGPVCTSSQDVFRCIQGYRKELEEREGEAPNHLQNIYTEQYIQEVLCVEHKIQHEEETVHDIFKPSAAGQKTPRVVLTRGDAGMGKTASVHKFCLDWARGSENQDLDLVVPLSFGKLNLTSGGRYSMLELIQRFYPSLQELSAEALLQCHLLFILDGLDESRLPLDFSGEVISDVTQRSEVSLLLLNLIRGNLLPAALIWVTSRPTTANRIPVQHVDRFTEIRGFTDQQIEQYFRRRFTHEDQCDRVLHHIRTSPTLYRMCQNPVFCWILIKVLNQKFESELSETLPLSLTDPFVLFLLEQMRRKRRKYEHSDGFQLTAEDCELLLGLGKLAFDLVKNGTSLFYQDDLQDLDLTKTLVHSGLCTEVLQSESVIFSQTAYSFVHPCVQEFLAAVYLLQDHNSLDAFLRAVRDKSLDSPNGHLDLCVRFLHGLTVEHNRRMLGARLCPNQPDLETSLKEMRPKQTSPERSCISLCLLEMSGPFYLMSLKNDPHTCYGSCQEALTFDKLLIHNYFYSRSHNAIF